MNLTGIVVLIHEIYGSDISSVTVDNSTFGPLSSKPELAIGTLDSSTAVTIRTALSIVVNLESGYVYL